MRRPLLGCTYNSCRLSRDVRGLADILARLQVNIAVAANFAVFLVRARLATYVRCFGIFVGNRAACRNCYRCLGSLRKFSITIVNLYLFSLHTQTCEAEKFALSSCCVVPIASNAARAIAVSFRLRANCCRRRTANFMRRLTFCICVHYTIVQPRKTRHLRCVDGQSYVVELSQRCQSSPMRSGLPYSQTTINLHMFV